MAGGEVPFTFYGDLLGVSGYYKLSAGIAYSKLDDFYNTSFLSLSRYCRENNANVIMFSDSLFLYGHGPRKALRQLHWLYCKLLKKGLLLRGAMVMKCLEFDPRITIENYQKMLPRDDTLARAVGLEKTVKGARLLIEPQLGERMLQECPEWVTHEGYIRHVNDDHYGQIGLNDIRRRICPTPTQDAFECLYGWPCDTLNQQDEPISPIDTKQLEEIGRVLQPAVAEHYCETLAVLARSEQRKLISEVPFRPRGRQRR
jgi:hypothetical protein